MAAATVESKVEEERPAFEKVTVVADGVSVTGKKAEAFRDYSTASERVHHAYKMMREHQTLEFAARMKAKYLTFSHPHTVWEAARLLDTVVDASDPDVDVGNSHHALQTAEALRRDGQPDWLQLVGLLHDLAKIAYHWGAEEDGNSGAEQWALVGDTFVLGCKIPDCVPLPQYNALSPYKDATDLGVYEPHCGLDSCTLSWGHDEHMYQVLVHHGTTIPPEGLHIIRYHSLYAHHQHDAYAHLCDEKDREFRKWLILFQKYDLYSKENVAVDPEELMPYYDSLIHKYLGGNPILRF